MENKKYIQCPKCSNRLERKRETWVWYPYCKHCDMRYDVFVNGDEMSITIKEHKE